MDIQLELAINEIMTNVEVYVGTHWGIAARDTVAAWRKDGSLPGNIKCNLECRDEDEDMVAAIFNAFYPPLDNAGLLDDDLEFPRKDTNALKRVVRSILINYEVLTVNTKNQLSEEALPEFIGQVIDGLEDYLTNEKNICSAELPNTYREEGNPAIICEPDYDDLADEIHGQVIVYDLTDNRLIVTGYDRNEIVLNIYNKGVRPILDKISGLNWTRDDAINVQRHIEQTFRSWGLFD